VKQSSGIIFYRNITVAEICLLWFDNPVKVITMRLFKRSVSAREKWHRKALFVNLSKTRIILVSTADPEPEGVPFWIPKKEPSSAIKELAEEEQYGPPWVFHYPCIRTTEISYGVEEAKSLTLFLFPRAFTL